MREGRDLQANPRDAAIQVIAAPPKPGATPEDVVRGFLQAGADFRGDHAVARTYLASPARQRWKAGSGTVVYDPAEAPFTVESRSDGSVVVSGVEVARIDGEGLYRPSAGSTRAERLLRMTRVRGQWRIAALADGLLLTPSDVRVAYRRVNLYFVAPSKKLLVADPVFLPALPGLSTKLVTQLLRGPTADLRGAVTTGFPQGTALALSSVPIRDGLASVHLDAAALKADSTGRALMSAQLVWTLKQLPEMRSLRITADGDDLLGTGAPARQSSDAWASYNPDGIADNPDVYFVRAGRIGRLAGSAFLALRGAAGAGRVLLQRPAISLDARQVAAVSADGRTLYLTRTVEGAALRSRLRGASLAAPSFDQVGNLWAVDRNAGRVWVLPAGSADRPVTVGVPALPAGRITDVRLARDGARVAVVAGVGSSARVYVGAVHSDPDGSPARLAALHEVLPDLHAVRAVAWVDAISLIVLGQLRADADVAVVLDTAGFTVAPLELAPSGLVSIAAAPVTRPILAATANGRLWEHTRSRGWESLGVGSDPVYPG